MHASCAGRGSRRGTNSVLVDIVRDSLEAVGIPADAVVAVGGGHEALDGLLADPATADVVIPRGGEELKKRLLRDSRIPVLAAAGGNCHVYVDASADAAAAVAIAVNAKTQRPGVCNAAETLLVHRDRPELRDAICAALREAGSRSSRARRRGRRSSSTCGWPSAPSTRSTRPSST